MLFLLSWARLLLLVEYLVNNCEHCRESQLTRQRNKRVHQESIWIIFLGSLLLLLTIVCVSPHPPIPVKHLVCIRACRTHDVISMRGGNAFIIPYQRIAIQPKPNIRLTSVCKLDFVSSGPVENKNNQGLISSCQILSLK